MRNDDVEALLEATATRVERDMAVIAAHWTELAADERAAVLGRLARSTPGVARLLCPGYGHFAPHWQASGADSDAARRAGVQSLA